MFLHKHRDYSSLRFLSFSPKFSLFLLFSSYIVLSALLSFYVKKTINNKVVQAAPPDFSRAQDDAPFNWESYTPFARDQMETRQVEEKIKKVGPLRSVSSESFSQTNQLQTANFQIAKILGQPNENETMVNRIVENRAFHAGGVQIDSQDRIYVFDSGNNRILGFNTYQNPTQNADLVIGQPQLVEKGSANGSNTAYTQPAGNTLAILPYPNVISTSEGPRSSQMANDAENNLYVVDMENNRILKYLSPFTTDTVADEVWGQPDMTGRQPYCGQNGFMPTASNFCLSNTGVEGQFTQTSVFSAGVEVDLQGNLWVTDTGNNRILRFPKSGNSISKTADLVLGQANFSSRSTPADLWNKSLSQMQKPVALKIKPQTGELYVLEGEWAGQARILVFSPPFTSGMSATREIGKAYFQDAQPSDSTHWQNISGKWVNLPTGLYWPRGFVFDPSGVGDIFVLDGGNQRAVLMASDGSLLDAIGQPDVNTRSCTGPQLGFIQFDGTRENLCEADGGIGVDAAGNIYISIVRDQKNVSRFATPLVRNSSGFVVSNGALLHRGWNQYSGRTFQDGYGMSKSAGSNSQLYVSDGQRVLVWNNPSSASTYSQADYVIGQDDFESNHNNNGGIFNGVITSSQTTDPSGYLYVSVLNSRIYAFAIPITGNGKNYPIHKTLFSNSPNSSQNIVWADDGTPVTFNPAGIAFDPDNEALYISDPTRQRILRVRDPLGSATVDLVIGQPDKNSASPNLGSTNPTRNGLHNPTYLSFDNFGNLYVVDGSYELNGNRRVLRFNASKLVPQPGNIFPLPQADAVFSKNSFTSRNLESGQPGGPTTVGFDSANRMVLIADGYGNFQFERVYVYNTPHLGEIVYPDHVIGIPVAQGGSVKFDENDQLIMQDHTWNRILFTTLSLPAPTPTLTPTPTNSPTPIITNPPSPTPTRTPSRTPTKTITPTPTTSTVELLKNPGFEADANNDGKPDAWTTNARFTKNNTQFHSGLSSGLHFSAANSGYNINQTVSNIIPGAAYTFSAWNNIPATSDAFTYRIQLIWRKSGGGTIRTDTLKTYTKSTPGWENTLVSTTAPANTRSVIVRMNLSSLKGPIYVDDFSLTK